MSPVMEHVKTINSLARTFIALVGLGLAAAAAWWGYSEFHADDIALAEKEEALVQAQREADAQRAAATAAQSQLKSAQQKLTEQRAEIGTLQASVASQKQEIAAQAKEIAVQLAEIERLDTAIALLKVDHRLAEIRVLEQGTDQETGKPFTRIEFVEVNEEGAPIDKPRTFMLQGDIVYIDYWTVKFEDKYVEESDLDRSTSICLFRRIFGEFQQPQEGYVLDEIGSRPTAYARGGKISDFEKKIWDDFWNIANNPEQAKKLGIRAAHGEAVSTKLREGKKYRLQLRASGGLTITPGEPAPPEPGS